MLAGWILRSGISIVAEMWPWSMSTRSACLGRTPLRSVGSRPFELTSPVAASSPDALGAGVADVDRDGAALGVERVDLALQRLEVLEALVDAGEADVGDLVDAAELLHRQRADAGRRDLGDAGGTQLGFDGVGGGFGGPVRDGPAGQGFAETGNEPVAIELLAHAIALDDDEPGGFDPLIGREPHRAGGALAPASDGGGIVEIPRVDDAGLPLAALGAAHRTPVSRAPLGIVVSTEDTTRWCGVARRCRGARGGVVMFDFGR